MNGFFLVNKEKITEEDVLEGLVKGSAIASFCVQKFGPEGIIEVNQKQLKDRINTITKNLI